MFLLTELSTFYLKFVLWVSPNHWLNGVRLGFLLLWGAVGLREVFQLLDDPDYNKIGRQSWMLLAVVITEVLVCVKFGWDTITIPLPRHIALWWMAFAGFLLVYTFIKFFIFKPTKLKEPEKDDVVHGSPVRQNSSESNNVKKTQWDLSILHVYIRHCVWKMAKKVLVKLPKTKVKQNNTAVFSRSFLGSFQTLCKGGTKQN